MGFMDWLLGKPGPGPAPMPTTSSESDNYVLGRPTGTPIRTWVVAHQNGEHFCTFEIYESGRRYRLWCAKGWVENHFYIYQAEDGAYRTLKCALHAATISIMPLVAGVFMSKLRSMNTGEPWDLQEPKALHIADVTFIEQIGGAFPLGQIYFDEDRMEVVEWLITDPDTNKRCDPPVFTVHVDANG